MNKAKEFRRKLAMGVKFKLAPSTSSIISTIQSVSPEVPVKKKPVIIKTSSPEKSSSSEIFEPSNMFRVRYKRWGSDPSKLKAHQELAIKWMLTRESKPRDGIMGGVNASEVGLGKSIEALTVIMRDYALPTPPKFPNLIVCPLSVIYTWEGEIDKWFGSSCKYFIFREEGVGKEFLKTLTIETLQKYHIIIINYDQVRTLARIYKIYDQLFELDHAGRHIGINRPPKPTEADLRIIGPKLLFKCPWQRILIDEGHTINNPKTFLFYSAMCLYSERKWAMTGTLIRNRPRDVFSVLKFIGFDGITNESQFSFSTFRQYRLNEFILNMTKETAGLKFPVLEEKLIILELAGEEKDVYNHFATGMKCLVDNFRSIDDKGMKFVNVLVLWTRLRQCCIAPHTITLDSEPDSIPETEELEVAKSHFDKVYKGLSSWIRDKYSSAGYKSCKILEILRLIREEIPLGEKVLIFSNFARAVHLVKDVLTKEGIGCSFVTGKIKGDKRKKVLDSFKTDKNMRALCLTYKVGSEGLTLIEANHVVFLETVWNPAIVKQALARVYRLGQLKKVIAYQMIIKDSIEEKMIQLCSSKQDVIDEFMGGTVLKKFTGEKLSLENMKRLLH